MTDFVVGLRGGIGTGKSTVSDLFSGYGIVVADADVSARTVVEPGKPAYHHIVAHFGREILHEDNTLDRAKLRDRVFRSEEDRRFLESQTHRPIIEDLMMILKEATSPYALLVLSTGTGRMAPMDRLLVVDAPREVQIERVMARDNNSREQVEAILNAQPDRETRVAQADDLIVNDSDAEAVRVEVEKLHQLYLQLSENKQPSGHG